MLNHKHRACQARYGIAKGEKIMSNKLKNLICRLAKATDAVSLLRRERMAAFFGSAGKAIFPQVVSANTIIFDLFAAWNGHAAPANSAVGFVRLVLSAERILSDFLKSTRYFTEQTLLQRLRRTKCASVRNISTFTNQH